MHGNITRKYLRTLMVHTAWLQYTRSNIKLSHHKQAEATCGVILTAPDYMKWFINYRLYVIVSKKILSKLEDDVVKS